MANYIGKQPGEVKPEGKQVVVYGPPFAGKTTSLAEEGFPVLLGDMDHNTSPLDSADNVSIFPIDKFEDYVEFKEACRKGYFVINKEKYPITAELIALDSFTRFEELIKDYVVRVVAPNRKREDRQTDDPFSRFGAQTDWDDLQRIEVREVRDWQAMTRSHGFNVVWLGHDMALHEDPNIETRVTRIQLALQGKYASPRIMSAVDSLVYIDREIVTNKETKQKEEQRIVYTKPFGVTQVDVRLPIDKRDKLPGAMPLSKFKWSTFLPYIGYRKKP